MTSLIEPSLDPSAAICAAIGLIFISGVPGLFLPNGTEWGQKVGTVLTLLGSLTGAISAVTILVTGTSTAVELSWGVPFGPCALLFDPLAAFFLLPIFLVAACSSLYARAYWRARDNASSERKLTFFFGVLASSLPVVVTAANGVLFLAGWEVMALSAFFTLTTLDEKREVRDAGTLYLITTHIGTLALFAMFSLLQGQTGSFAFPGANSLDASSAIAVGIFIAALIGFGLKAGLMPLHVWLPSAHANAPSHVSALMSGVLIKTGIYGLVRTFSFFNHIPLWWGTTVLVAGIVSGILGVVFAIAQHDLKRLLAYHSIENIGIIAMGLGIGLIGRAADIPALALLGIAGALLHVLNHAIFKSLLFFSAGSVIHAIGTRDIDHMGGIARRAPFTTAGFLVGAVAICGLPPLNGFVSEFLIYIGIFSGIVAKGGERAVPFLAAAAPSLALIGGLAAACFIKVYGVAFLGLPRSREGAHVHECPWPMRLPLLVLSTLCALIGLLPLALAPLLQHAAVCWHPDLGAAALPLTAVAPLQWITVMGALLLALGAAAGLIFLRRLARAPSAEGVTWDCGYLAPAPRMQYTSSSFGDMLVRLFGGVLRPHRERPSFRGSFPATSHFSSHVPETVLDLVYLPFLSKANARLAVVRKLQHGQLHLYILYIFITVVVLLVWSH